MNAALRAVSSKSLANSFTDLHEERRWRVRREPTRQLQGALYKVVGRAREAGAEGLPHDRDPDGIRAAGDQLIDGISAHEAVLASATDTAPRT